MPCNGDYLNPSGLEQQAAQCACLLDELNNKTFTRSDWDGYHPATYNKIISRESLDSLVRDLCSRLQSLPRPITDYSLELQTWWRDHQVADEARRAGEQLAEQRAAVRRQALAKLTPIERHALGLSEPHA
jgi:hypothetical protein